MTSDRMRKQARKDSRKLPRACQKRPDRREGKEQT
jgi:hypothetical protein